MATKQAIKAAYLRKLQAAYPFYIEGNRPYELACLAADAALSGKQKIKGACWDAALSECGIVPRLATLKALAALPEA